MAPNCPPSAVAIFWISSSPWSPRRRGLHGLELIQKMATADGGQFGAIYADALHRGCAGSARVLSASSLAAGGIAASGTPERLGRWIPECYGLGDEIKFGAYA